MRMIAFVAALTTVFYFFRRRYMRWGATDEEVQAPLPGDELIPAPGIQSTRAVTIDSQPEYVWPWLVQMGYGRGGFYSFDWAENGFTKVLGMSAHYESVDEILPEYQRIEVDDFIPASPQQWHGRPVKAGWRVARVEPDRVLALENWGTFVLQPLEGGRTRLIARTRGKRSLASFVWNIPWEIPHFIMERQMLLGIKERAERLAAERAVTAESISA